MSFMLAPGHKRLEVSEEMGPGFCDQVIDEQREGSCAFLEDGPFLGGREVLEEEAPDL
jgi:hypothetical protein